MTSGAYCCLLSPSVALQRKKHHFTRSKLSRQIYDTRKQKPRRTENQQTLSLSPTLYLRFRYVWSISLWFVWKYVDISPRIGELGHKKGSDAVGIELLALVLSRSRTRAPNRSKMINFLHSISFLDFFFFFLQFGDRWRSEQH